MMKRGLVVLIAALVASLAVADVGQAQPPASVHVQGTLRAVDCSAQSVTLDTGSGTGTYRAAGGATFYVNGAGTSLCALQQTVGAPATVWLTAYSNELVVTRVDVAAQTYAPPPATTPAPAPAPPAYTPQYPAAYPVPYPYPVPVPTPAPYYGPYYPPLAGVVLGTIIVAGLTYLLVRAANGAFYRYPYYGPYYRYYYRSYYRPYSGPYLYAPAFGYGPYRYCPYYRAWSYWCR